ncbi:MAG: 2-C-methyl-D-erythritol 4-phosphate cytidylyltransferase [Microbacteriaceae bacterium]|nr:2-C-methyl-D-erythritol 4-phosphate cytidylyltransferase [Microbacteriaceae bacterium]
MRLGLGLPKALAPLAGRPILDWCLDGVLAADIDSVVIAAPAAQLDAVRRMISTRPAQPPISVVPGGPSRQASVAAALATVDDDVVLVHDAARPLTPPALFDAVRAAVVAGGSGVVPALTPADTIKVVDPAGAVRQTLDRSALAAVQTPQGFPAADLRRAYTAADREHTDDAALFAAAGGAVTTVPGEPAAFKITTPWDLQRAEHLLAPVGAPRTGIGVDVHAFDPDRPLRLGGLEWPGEPGLAGHSDADAVCHALCDALLSAAGLGDLGSRFGVDRPEERDRAGLDFVHRTVALLAEAGWRPGNGAVQVVGRRPRIASRRAEMERTLTAALGAPVSVSGTTTDGLGFAGRGEGIAAVATALVTPMPPGKPLEAGR